jgi:hypothetical protein
MPLLATRSPRHWRWRRRTSTPDRGGNSGIRPRVDAAVAVASEGPGAAPAHPGLCACSGARTSPP